MTDLRAPGWGAPVTALVAGLLSVPLLFLSPMSFVFSLLLVPASLFVATVVVLERRPLAHLVTATVGGAAGCAAVLLAVLPYLLQE